MCFNPALWDNTAALGNYTEYSIAYLYVAAHFLTLNIQGAGGLSKVNMGRGVDSQGGGTIESKGVGPVNISYAIPEHIKNSEILGQFMRTDFGQKYLVLVTPRLVGNVQVVSGVACSPGNWSVFANVVQQIKIITLSPLPSGTHAVAYSTTIQATGGVSTYTWSVVTGSLPAGITLAPSGGTFGYGVLSGTPTTAGTYTFEVQVEDIMGNTAFMNYTLVIT